MSVSEQGAAGHIGSASRPSAIVRVVSVLAWMMIGAGVLVVLYLAYSLLFTNLRTGAEQSRLMSDWQTQVGTADSQPIVVPTGVPTEVPTDLPPTPGAESSSAPPMAPTPRDDPVVAASPESSPPAPPSGEAVALLWFERPGAPPPVTDEPYVVLSGVTLADLAKGPGHYPQTDGPGEQGNFAVAGHRTTNGAPFFHLDDLRQGDEIHVMDTDGREHVYAVREERIVSPSDTSVLRAQPFADVDATITLTTCHPRFSNRQRLIVFGELVT